MAGSSGRLSGTAGLTAFAIYATQRRRFRRAVHGINQERMPADVASTMSLAGSVVLLAWLGLYTVLYLPLQP